MCTIKEWYQTFLPQDKVEKLFGLITDQEAYSIVWMFQEKQPFEQILQTIKDKRLGFNNSIFDDYRETEDEEDEFISNPIDVKEGALVCKRCKSKYIYAYSKQVRAADEGMTTFAMCVKCGAKWTE